MKKKLLTSEPPKNCPGTNSEDAGKSEACQGCPNQGICSTGIPVAPDSDMEAIRERMSTIKNKIIILSGKGGVGKSTVSTQLAFTLSRDKNIEVGLLDIDICGPSIPLTLGLQGEQVHCSGSGWQPVFVSENLCAMSIGFLLPRADEPVIWRGPKKNGLIRQFLREVEWGSLEYLLIDAPPGTSDEHLSIVQLLKEDLTGAVVVATPQSISLLDVRKEINFCKKVGLPLIGVVENMSGFVCQHCKKSSELFTSSEGGAERMASAMGCPFLGRISVDPRVGRCTDSGLSYVDAYEDQPVAVQFLSLAKKVSDYCLGKKTCGQQENLI
ncbi:cytosolic Fe-S cluster assembly factor NUBP1 homolog isoform X2 [Zophobas morio]|uniref:cytosolic Fe-S cluster assembly factor NUBP1 homolog isoform X2 n=1 Tax=Zophobas morio TaxID=2755281 RepID=UPI003083BC9A